MYCSSVLTKISTRSLLVTTVGTTRSVSTPTNIQLSGIKHDNPQARDIFGCMAKLKQTVFAALQLYFCSGYYPIWEYPVGMRKPGLLSAARLSAHRAHVPIFTLFVVIFHLAQRNRTGTRLPSVIYPQNTIFSPVLFHFHLLAAIFFSTTNQLLVPTESSPKLPSRTFSKSYRKYSQTFCAACFSVLFSIFQTSEICAYTPQC